ncbi:MAG: PorT family protein [Lewinellaceae bacterium]|nr:PorT family protein [Lewinellaceae bacterium]
MILVMLCLGTALHSLRAQGLSNYGNNYRDFANKAYYFGLSFGINNSNYQIDRGRRFIGNEVIKTVESIGGPGFTVGVITNMKVGDYFDLRVIPSFAFIERNIRYSGSALLTNDTTSIESSFFEIPFQIRYKSKPYKDVKLYLVGGLKYGYDISSKSRTKRLTDEIRLSPHDFSVEAGAGFQIFLPYVIFSPEVKFTQGIGNVMIYRNELPKSNVLEKIFSRMFTISFHFEG